MTVEYPLSRADYTDLEESYVLDWMRNRQGPGWRYYIEKCEQWFCQACGKRFAMMTNSARSALHLAFEAMSCVTGNRIVVVPDLTYDATADAAALAGLTVTTEDVDAGTWTTRRWTDSASYIYAPVYLYGNEPCIPKERAVVDAAEAMGTPYVGQRGEVVCFSFNGSKTIGAGEGGMLVTDNVDVYDYAMRRGACLNRDDWATEIVRYNYRANPIAAALAWGQLQRLDELADRKRQINGWYREMLDGWQFQQGETDPAPAWWLTGVLLPEGVEPQPVIDELYDRGIQARRTFRPISGQAHHDHRGERHGRRAHPNAWRIYDRGLCLPSAVQMTKDDVATVCGALKEVVQEVTTA